MKRTTIAIAVAFLAILLIAAVGIAGNWNRTTANTGSASLGPPGTAPENITGGSEHLELAASYAGAGNSSYNYDCNTTYTIVLKATPIGDWSGNLSLVAFVVKQGQNIGQECVNIGHGGSSTVWNVTDYGGHVMENGRVLVMTTNGSSNYILPIALRFNETGTGQYNVSFQAFDANGNAISQPLHLTEMNVPAAGSLEIEQVGHGGFVEINGTSYYEVGLNVTNGWNARHSVYAQNLTLMVGGTSVKPDTVLTNVSGQSLAPGQLTQFQVYFPASPSGGTVQLTYDDNGSVISIPVG